MVYIARASYGDEKTARDITEVLNDKISGTSLDVPVDEKLIPTFTVVDKAELDAAELKKITTEATKSCGTAADQTCMEATKSRLQQEALAQKQRAADANAPNIKGKRITVEIVDDSGKRKTVVVPEGQRFKLDNIKPGGQSGLPSMSYVQTQVGIIIGSIFASLTYAFNIMATWTLFAPIFGREVAGGLTAVSALVPYSGFVMIALYFGTKKFISKYVGIPDDFAIKV